MKDKTKKWMATAGLMAVCAGLVFGIGAALYREPAQETLDGGREIKDAEITVDIGEGGAAQAWEKESDDAADAESKKAEIGTDTEESLVIKIDADTDVPLGGKEQSIQPKPEKTEKEKPSDPPASSEDGDTEEPGTQPDDEEPKEPGPQPPAETLTPKTGDIKDGMMYVEGFGWVPYEGGGGEGVYAEDMYENGNKIGIMD